MKNEIRLKRIALVALDNKKKELIEWAYFNKATLIRHGLFGTGTTGKLIEDELGCTRKKAFQRTIGWGSANRKYDS